LSEDFNLNALHGGTFLKKFQIRHWKSQATSKHENPAIKPDRQGGFFSGVWRYGASACLDDSS